MCSSDLHAGIYVLPALLAEAEATSMPTREVLRVLVMAYETVTRFARTFPTITQTFHPHAAYSAVGAAAAIGLARGLDAETFRAALCNAATMVAPGPSGHTGAGALVRNVWPAAGATNGMRAVDWAVCGIAGLAGSAHDVYATGLGADCRPAEMSADLGGVWAITQNFQKLHACCQFLCGLKRMPILLIISPGSVTIFEIQDKSLLSKVLKIGRAHV